MTNKMKLHLSLSLYINYIIHGFGLIILAQNMASLGHLWNAPIATVSYVVSGIGIGRLLAYFTFGYLSDRFGRKLLIYIGMGTYLIFFTGIPFAPNIQVAYVLSILAGVANSGLDSGTYPTFMEMGGKESASNVFIKAAMSLGEFVLPLLVTMLEAKSMWFGWSFMLPVALLVINLILVTRVQFPHRNQAHQTGVVREGNISSAKKWIASGALSIYGYSSMAVMILFTQWITMYSTKELGYSSLVAHGLLSLYSLGSISGVVIVFALLRRQVSESLLLIVNNLISLLALIVICMTTVQMVSAVGAFIFGFTAASGMMQVALNMFLRLFPTHKGIVTGTYFMFGSIATFTVPIVTGWLSKTSIALAMQFDILIAILGTIVVIVAAVMLREKHALSTMERVVSE